MKASLVVIVALAVIASANASFDLGIGFGQVVDPESNIDPIPMLSIGTTFGDVLVFSPNVSAVGFSDRWEFFGTAAVGYGPARLGLSVDEDYNLGSFVGFEAPLTSFARVSSRVIGLGSDRGVYASTGLVLSL